MHAFSLSISVAVLSLFLSPTVAGAAMIAEREVFPAWELVDQSGQMVSSRELAGKTYLLWFYPKAMTPGCTAEGRSLRDAYADFRSEGVEVLGISFDAPEENARFIKQESFPYRLLSDRNRNLGIAVGAATDASQTMARRISYLVGGDGKVLRAYSSVDPARHASEVLADIKKLGQSAGGVAR